MSTAAATYRTLERRARRGRRLPAGHRGSAVAEFAIVSVVLVSIMLWSHFFVDLVEAKLKSQEMARYAVWEVTGFQLSDHLKKKHKDLLNKAQNDTKTDAEKRFETMISTVAPGKSRPTSAKKRFSLDVGTVTLRNSSKKDGWVSLILNRWNFNDVGMITAQSSIGIENTTKLLPRRIMDRDFGQLESPNYRGSVGTGSNRNKFNDKAVLTVDTWALNEGKDISWASGKDYTGSEYYAVVKRMVLAGGAHGALGEAQSAVGKVVSFFAPINPMDTFIASLNYKEGKPGIIKLTVDGGARNFHTVNYCTINSNYGGIQTCNSEMAKAFKKRGKFYLGCKEDQKDVCDYK